MDSATLARKSSVGRTREAHNSRVRTAFVLPSLMRAGAETQTVSLVNGLDSGAFEKHLFVFERQMDQYDRLDLNEVSFCHVARRGRFDTRPISRLAALIDERNIEVLHCSLQIALFVGWSAARISTRTPQIVVALHTTKNVRLRDEMFDLLLYQWLMRSCARIICVCKAQERHWIAKYPFLQGRTVVVYNGIDPTWFDPLKVAGTGWALREKLGIGGNAFVATCVAGFRPEKRHDLILRAFAELLRQQPDSVLLLAGDGPERGTAQQFAMNLGISRAVRFLGLVVDVRPVLAASNASIIASTAVETFSIAMLESLAMKVPMVATDIGGASEAVVTGQTGLLVRPGEFEDLAHGLIALASNQSAGIQMGVNGRVLVEEKFTLSRMTQSTAAVLLAAAGRASDP